MAGNKGYLPDAYWIKIHPPVKSSDESVESVVDHRAWNKFISTVFCQGNIMKVSFSSTGD